MENDPDNIELKEQYEKEWNEVVAEIKEINEYNEHMKRINETSDEKVDAKDNNMSFAGDISRRGDQPTIDEIKVLLTDNNSVSEDELQQHNKIQNDYKKYIQERYNDMMSHRPNTNGLIRSRNTFNKAKPLLDEYEEEIGNNSGENRNENILKDLNDIKELNIAIQRSNFSGDDIEMMKNRALPPTPVTTGVSTPDTPLKYQYSNDSPSRPLDTFDTASDRHNDNYDTLSNRGYESPDYVSYKRSTVGGYMDNQNDAAYYPSPGMNPMNVNPGMSEAAALEWDQLKREVETEELIKLEKLENSSDIDIDIDMDVNMGMPMGRNRGMPMGMNRGMPMGMNRGMPMDMGMNRGMPMGMSRGMPMDMGMPMGMNRGMPMDMGMPMGMNRGMPMDIGRNMGMNRGMPIDMGMNMGMDMEMELNMNMDSVTDIMESNNEYKGNKALKLLGVVSSPQGKNKYGGPTSPTKPNRPYISPTHPYMSPNQPFPPNQKISMVPPSEFIPMSGIGMGKNPVRIGEVRNDPRYMNDMALMNHANRASLERLNNPLNPPSKPYKALGINTNIINNNTPEHTPVLKNSLNSPLTSKQTINNRNSSTFGGPVKRINEIRNSSQELVNDSMLSSNSNTSNGNNGKTKRYSKNRATNSIDFSRPRDPKEMKPEEKLDAMLLPSLTTLRQVSINELVAKNAKNILVSGYLLKRSSSLFKKWKQRYFILCAENLYCFASENPKERALTCIPITKDAVVRTQVEDNKYIFVFIAVWYEFNIVQREFYLQTNTEEEMNLWVKQLKMAINVEKLKRTSLPKVPEIPPTVVETNKRYSKRNSNFDNNNSNITANNNSVSNTAAKYGGSARTSEEITYRNNESFDSDENSLNSSSIPSIVNEAFIRSSPSSPTSQTQSSSEDELVFPTRVSSADKESRLRHQILKNQQELEKLYNRNKERASNYSESYSRSSSKQDTPTNRSHHSSRSSHTNHSNYSNRSNHSHHSSSKHESNYSIDPNEKILKNLNLDDDPNDQILKNLNLDDLSDSDSDDDNNYSEKNRMSNKNNYNPREENRMKAREGNPKNENINRARMRRQNQHQRTRSGSNSFNKNEATNNSNISNNNSTFNHNNNSSIVNRSETIVIDGNSDENANLFVYQKILSTNKTNYRFDGESMSMKNSDNSISVKTSENEENSKVKETENEESKIKDYKNISSSSISVSTTSPFSTSMSSSISSFSLSSLSSPTVSENDSMDENRMKKKLEIKKASQPTTHKIKKMNNGTKKINVLIDSLDKLKMSQEEDKPIVNKNPMLINPDKSRSETTDSSMMTQTEEYFNKALSELAALSSLSKKI